MDYTKLLYNDYMSGCCCIYFLFPKDFLIFILCIWEFSCMYIVCHVCAVLMEARKGHQILWNWMVVFSRHVGARTKIRSLNCLAISLYPQHLYFFLTLSILVFSDLTEKFYDLTQKSKYAHNSVGQSSGNELSEFDVNS